MAKALSNRQIELVARNEKCCSYLRILANNCDIEKMHICARQLRKMATEFEQTLAFQIKALQNPDPYLQFGEQKNDTEIVK